MPILKQWICTTERKSSMSMTVSSATASEKPNLLITGNPKQTIRGFGGCFNELGWLALSSLDAIRRRKILDDLFAPAGNGCKFNIGRIPIGASDYAAQWYSLNETDGDLKMRKFSIARDKQNLIPYVREAVSRNRNMFLFASPWSPPTWMKSPRAYNHGTMIWRKDILKAYALYFTKFVRKYRREGIPVAAIHPQNEPVSDQKFPSCVWTGSQLRDFIRDYLGPAFEKSSPNTKIWLGTLNTEEYDQYVHDVLIDPRARKYIAGIGLQWAGKGMIQRINDSWPTLELMQTENECGDGKNSWQYAKYVFDLIRHYIANGASSYVYWNMTLPPGGASTWGWRQNAMITIDPEKGKATYNSEYHIMRHISGFVRSGAIYIETAGMWSANSLAFRNPDGNFIIAIKNPSNSPARLSIGISGEIFPLRLPADSVSTIVIGER